MPALPGRDSLDSVTRWHGFYEIAGIVCLALLVAVEVLAYQYGYRKDELIAAAEALMTQQYSDAEARRREEVTALQRQLSDAEKMFLTSANNKHQDDFPLTATIACGGPF
jgi:hypothetical protein